ncbi:MAG: PIN domain-containing protein [Methylobacter sp.]
MSDKRFIYSNIWLCMPLWIGVHQGNNQALQLIDGAGIMLSTQVINEVRANLLRKASYTESEIQQTIGNFQARYPILNVTTNVIRQASVLRESYSFSYGDSMVIATAKEADCPLVYSEDMQNGQQIGNLKIINPLPRAKRILQLTGRHSLIIFSSNLLNKRTTSHDNRHL